MIAAVVLAAGTSTRMGRPKLLLPVGGKPLIRLSVECVLAAGLEEIVVTARKREERLQETPISITAMSGDALAARQIETTQELARVAPNLIVSQGQSVSGNSSAGAYFIRGIGQIDFLLNTDPGVGLYIDGVYVARSIGSILDLIDVERVEVLRGPQGTLFGRNTIGGAISVVSRPPSDTFSADARATLGSFDLYDARLTMNGPIADTLDGKVAVLWRERDGWVDRLTDGSRLGDEESLGARAALRWDPTDSLVVDLALDYVDQDGVTGGDDVVGRGRPTGSTVTGYPFDRDTMLAGRLLYLSPNSCPFYRLASQFDCAANWDKWGYNSISECYTDMVHCTYCR